MLGPFAWAFRHDEKYAIPKYGVDNFKACNLFRQFNPSSLEGGGGQIDPPPSIFLALNFCSLTDCQKLWHNCSLFVNTFFDTNYVTS